MSWQTLTYLRLRGTGPEGAGGRGWHRIGALFEAVEAEIPLHLAMRVAMQPGRGRTELPTNSEARWVKFLNGLSAIGVETSGERGAFKWQDEVRLRYVADRACPQCGGPVIKAGWQARHTVACLACDSPAPVPVEVPAVPAPPRPPAPEPLPWGSPASQLTPHEHDIVTVISRRAGLQTPVDRAIAWAMVDRIVGPAAARKPARRGDHPGPRAPPVIAPQYRITIHLGEGG